MLHDNEKRRKKTHICISDRKRINSSTSFKIQNELRSKAKTNKQKKQGKYFKSNETRTAVSIQHEHIVIEQKRK